jgi:hypothetical protein
MKATSLAFLALALFWSSPRIPLRIGETMLENPKCPRCGKTGADLSLVGRQDRSETYQADTRRLSTLFAYQCQCGMTFTHTLWEERAANNWK